MAANPPSTTSQRVADFAASHRRAIYVAAIALAAAGTAGYLLYSNSSPPSAGSSRGSSPSAPTKTTKRKRPKRKDGTAPATGEQALETSTSAAVSDSELDGLTHDVRRRLACLH